MFVGLNASRGECLLNDANVFPRKLRVPLCYLNAISQGFHAFAVDPRKHEGGAKGHRRKDRRDDGEIQPRAVMENGCCSCDWPAVPTD